MDLKEIDTLQALLQNGFAQSWEFEGRTGIKLLPKTALQVAQLLAWCNEQNKPTGFTETEAALLPQPCWIDLSLLNKVRQHPVDDFIIQVECGMTYRELLAAVAPHKQVWPLSYPPNLTLGEILADERPALETGLRGYPRDYVLKTELATPDGQLTISGADVVKNVTGYDLAKLHISGKHSFGLLTSVTLKLMALPPLRKQWLYQPDTLNNACVLSAQLLASKMPLSICELFHQAGKWYLLLEITGDEPVLTECEALLNQLGIQVPSEALDTRSGHALIYELQNQPADQTIIEFAFPLSRWQGFMNQITKQTSLGEMRFQIRPAAGLVYLSAPQFPFAALRYLQNEAKVHEGMLQIINIAKTDVTTASEATAAYQEFNLPTEPVLRRLLQNLKKSYDPKGILFTPRLPLT
jgi:FAD/FMN-containing dehydrogenase